MKIRKIIVAVLFLVLRCSRPQVHRETGLMR
jgi:hypothetical protein